MQNLENMKGMINEDWEMEFQKDFVYLQEEIEELKQEIYPLMQPIATIEVVDEDDILERLKDATKVRTISHQGDTKEQPIS